MSWYRQNANSLLKLTPLKLNGEWDAYWQTRKEELVRLDPKSSSRKKEAHDSSY
jgi:hypothetical protein